MGQSCGSTTRRSSGDSPERLESIAWMPNGGSPTTHRVGSEAPTAFGLFDMHGNAWEWCLDSYNIDAPGPETDPKGPPVGRSGGRHRRLAAMPNRLTDFPLTVSASAGR